MLEHRQPSPRKPDRVVLIGAHGFIGAVIERQLHVGGIATLGLKREDIDLVQADACDRLAAKLRSDDAVVMLAAITPDKARDAAAFIGNIAMMQSVCAAIEKKGCAHFVYFSSDAVYPRGVSRVTEETPPSPGDPYGAMHLARELMARNLQKTAVLVLRPTQVYGREDTHGSYGPNKFRRAALGEGKIALSDSGKGTRDHIDVEDVAALTIRCLLHRSVGTLNAATGVSHSFLDVANLIARQFGVEVTTARDEKPITHRHYDITNTIRAFPDIRFTTLEQGLDRVHREVKERGDGRG